MAPQVRPICCSRFPWGCAPQELLPVSHCVDRVPCPISESRPLSSFSGLSRGVQAFLRKVKYLIQVCRTVIALALDGLGFL
jgi:hypothetical protein